MPQNQHVQLPDYGLAWIMLVALIVRVVRRRAFLTGQEVFVDRAEDVARKRT